MRDENVKEVGKGSLMQGNAEVMQQGLDGKKPANVFDKELISRR